MTKILLEIGKPVGWSKEDGYRFAEVANWCEDCFLDRTMFKCHAAFRRPDGVFLDDVFHYLRPVECKQANKESG